ncbi:hypothetical protein BDW22DRAFT_720871 [Trametopsis cervina]|nr:hypothetical protein BDW22DRAFT_720871 [Trametopsis cervina]
MSSTLRTLTKHARLPSRPTSYVPSNTRARAFHSPFAVLSSQPPSSPTPSHTHTQGSPLYEKPIDTSAHPTLAPGQRHYVVSEPDPRSTPYSVPYGAYPTSAPYQPLTPTSPPNPTGAHSSSSADAPHPVTTAAADQNKSGASNASAGVRCLLHSHNIT